MKALSFVFILVVAMGLGIMGCSDNADRLVAPNHQVVIQSSQETNALTNKLSPTFTATINLGFFPGNAPYFWVGTITFGTETYGVRYKSVGDPPKPPPRAFVFDERFEIYEAGYLGNPAYLLLEGPDAGVVPCGNDMFVANGYVETANGPFEMWLGRNVHSSGTITWVIPCVLPAGATGIFRMN